MEGLTVLEYFISTHGARKGLADTALRTADSGYLTRRLVDVSQDVIVRAPGTTRRLRHRRVHRGYRSSSTAPEQERRGRVAAVDIHKPIKDGKPGKTVVVAKGAGDHVSGSPEPRRGARRVCRHRDGPGSVGAQVPQRVRAVSSCYGTFLATGGMTEIGDAVGIIAAQSIGEPGTGSRCARSTRAVSRGGRRHHARPTARRRDLRGSQPEGRGDARGRRREGRRRGRGAHDQGDDHAPALDADGELPDPKEYAFPPADAAARRRATSSKSDAASTRARSTRRTPVSSRARRSTELYLVGEVQKVYKSQGVEIHDKHIELIVRQMLKKVRVETNGDTELLPGQTRRQGRPRARERPCEEGEGRARDL